MVDAERGLAMLLEFLFEDEVNSVQDYSYWGLVQTAEK